MPLVSAAFPLGLVGTLEAWTPAAGRTESPWDLPHTKRAMCKLGCLCAFHVVDEEGKAARVPPSISLRACEVHDLVTACNAAHSPPAHASVGVPRWGADALRQGLREDELVLHLLALRCTRNLSLALKGSWVWSRLGKTPAVAKVRLQLSTASTSRLVSSTAHLFG
eukprot:3504472-Amphidinium_carterae.1